MCKAALVGNSVLTLRWMDEDHHPRTMTGKSYGKMLRNEAGRSREGWIVSVVVTTGRRRTQLHQGKSGVLGGEVSWAGDLKGKNPWPPYSPDLSPLPLGVRKCQGLQAAARYNPSAQGNRRGSCGKPQQQSPSRHHGQLQEKMRSFSRV